MDGVLKRDGDCMRGDCFVVVVLSIPPSLIE